MINWKKPIKQIGNKNKHMSDSTQKISSQYTCGDIIDNNEQDLP